MFARTPEGLKLAGGFFIYIFLKFFLVIKIFFLYLYQITNKNTMKNLIKKAIKTNGEALDFATVNSFGHIQLNRNEWAIFFNAECVHVSKTLGSAIKKLERLGVNESNFQ